MCINLSQSARHEKRQLLLQFGDFEYALKSNQSQMRKQRYNMLLSTNCAVQT